jgi:DNA-binding NtrC family response regulator
MSDPFEHREATILIAEDDPSILQLLKANLERSGAYSLLLADDGQKALFLASDHKGGVDLLIASLQMPGMTGTDLARELKRSHPNMRVMLISPYPQGLLILHKEWTFLQKPFLPSAILDSVREVLSRPV